MGHTARSKVLIHPCRLQAEPQASFKSPFIESALCPELLGGSERPASQMFPTPPRSATPPGGGVLPWFSPKAHSLLASTPVKRRQVCPPFMCWFQDLLKLLKFLFPFQLFSGLSQPCCFPQDTGACCNHCKPWS